MNKITLILVLSLILFSSVIYSGALSATDMSNPDYFLKMGIGARPFGMGGAFTAVADDANATYYNPAGLADLKYWELFSMHSNSYDFDINYDYVDCVVPLLPGKVIGISYASLKTDDIPITRDKVPTILGYTSDKESAYILSYGHRLSDYISLGVNLKSLKQEVYIGNADGTEADFALLYTPSRTMRFGLNFQDALPTSMEWNTGSSVKIPLTIRGGMAIHLHDWGTIFALDVNKVEGRDPQFNGGMEYQFNESFQGRFGFNDGDLTAGFSYIRDSWRVDYAYKKSDLGDTNRFSTGFRFNSFLLEKMFRRPRKPQCGKHKISKLKCNTGCNNGRVNSLVANGANLATNPMIPGKSARTSVFNNNGIKRVTLKKQPNINEVMADNGDITIKNLKNSSLMSRRGNIQKLENRGNKLLLSGKYDDAATCYREMVRIAPSQEVGHIKLAGIYHYQKKYSEAIEEYKDAIAANPSNLDNYINVATLYAKLKEYDKAAEAALIVTKLSPGSPKAKMAEQMYNNFTGRKNMNSDGFNDDITFENQRSSRLLSGGLAR